MDRWSRRQTIAGIAASLAASKLRAEPAPSLALIAARNRLSFGAAMRAGSLDDPVIAPLLRRECATLTPELEWKWAAVAPAPDCRDWAAADRIAAFARGAGMRLRGHTLLWHGSVPGWVAARLSSGSDWALVGDHIRALVSRYRTQVDEWDVVNEPIQIGDRPDGLRVSPFLETFGPDYIARAFHDAHAVAPRARLMINEYDLEYALPEHRARREALLALARSLVRRKVPIHGIGIQAHLDLGKGSIDTLRLRDFVMAVSALGLRISITELDVKERYFVGPPAERDRLVAEHVSAFLATMLPGSAVQSMTCWGIADRQSWLEVTAADRARFPGAWADGSSPGLNRGLPYDSDGSPKPMRDAIADALAVPRA